MFKKVMRKLGYVKLRDADEVLKENEQLKQIISSKVSIIEELTNSIKSKETEIKDLTNKLNEYKSVYPSPVKKKTYAVIFKQQGLLPNTQFAINVGGTMYYSKPDEDSITAYLQEGEYDYIVMPMRGYRIDPEKGHILVNNNYIVLINFRSV